MEKTLRPILVGKAEDLPQKLGKTVTIGRKEIAVFKLENGKIHAIENRCPHKGGVLAEGIVSGEFVYCPLHDWKISVMDGRVQAPDVGCVQSYPVEIRDGQVFIFLN
ncbi:nitrite reductase small subunit NirD [Neobacillus bataviensis]|uniref:nitrite reductase small subunit NirD n=1 Tax=Neobacillus bataviensis TaxID=220685 RepID=UPI001CC0ACD0|nr:nitrite reductase small subunit NirD [Neobacillus bataviensis]